MSVAAAINFTFDLRDLNRLPDILSWFSDRSETGHGMVKVKFPDGETRTFNFSHRRKDEDVEFDFSKGIPEGNEFDVSFLIRKTDKFVKNYIWRIYCGNSRECPDFRLADFKEVQEVEASLKDRYKGKNIFIQIKGQNHYIPIPKGDYMHIGYFYLRIFPGRKYYTLVFDAATSNLGIWFTEWKETREFILDFCKAFNPKKGFFTLDDLTQLFWTEGKPRGIFRKPSASERSIA